MSLKSLLLQDRSEKYDKALDIVKSFVKRGDTSKFDLTSGYFCPYKSTSSKIIIKSTKLSMNNYQKHIVNILKSMDKYGIGYRITRRSHGFIQLEVL